jgi:prepilin-type N-terminal cleavage/methylation domain-containing protein
MNQLNRQNDTGFTLVELAVVLVIVGIVAGLGMGLLGSMTKRVKFIETRDTVKMVFDAITGYAVANKRLPANLTVLGVKTTDSFSSNLFYDVATGITASDLCSTQGTYLTINDLSAPAKTNIAFIILSEGENRCPETGASTPYTIIDTGVTGSCVADATAGYDDIVMYLDIDTLREQICNPFKIVTESLPLGTEAVAYSSTTIQATDGTTPYVWSSSGTLPPALALNAVSGQITGTPTSDGTFSFTVSVTDVEGRTASKSFAITINPNDPQINTNVLHNSTVGTLYSATISANGGTGTYTWTISGVSWLSVVGAGATASISGTPVTAGTYALTVQITDGGGRTDSRALSIAINN